MRARESVRTEGGNETDTHIIEMELKPEELDRLTQAQTAPACTDVMATTSSIAGKSRRVAAHAAVRMALPLCVSIGAALLAIGATRVVRIRPQPAPPVVAGGAIERTAPPAAPPVRFANPFDASEVFEFPAGTTRAEAHDRVAEILLQRARERIDLRTAKRSRHRNPPTPVTAQSSARMPLESGALPRGE
jgi:hypothetical protein